MDWPHDPDGDEGSEGRRKYGHAVLAKKIDEDEDFPFSADTYVEEYGDHPVRIDYETVVSISEIFEPIDDDTIFATFSEFHRRVGKALRSEGFWPLHLDRA